MQLNLEGRVGEGLIQSEKMGRVLWSGDHADRRCSDGNVSGWSKGAMDLGRVHEGDKLE